MFQINRWNLHGQVSREQNHSPGRFRWRTYRSAKVWIRALNRKLGGVGMLGIMADIHSEVIGDYIPEMDSFSRSNLSLSGRLDSSPRWHIPVLLEKLTTGRCMQRTSHMGFTQRDVHRSKFPGGNARVFCLLHLGTGGRLLSESTADFIGIRNPDYSCSLMLWEDKEETIRTQKNQGAPRDPVSGYSHTDSHNSVPWRRLNPDNVSNYGNV